MKKIFSILTIILLTCSSLNATTSNEFNRCSDWAIEQADAEEQYYGPMSDSDWSQAVGDYYGMCIESALSGSELLDAVFN